MTEYIDYDMTSILLEEIHEIRKKYNAEEQAIKNQQSLKESRFSKIRILLCVLQFILVVCTWFFLSDYIYSNFSHNRFIAEAMPAIMLFAVCVLSYFFVISNIGKNTYQEYENMMSDLENTCISDIEKLLVMPGLRTENIIPITMSIDESGLPIDELNASFERPYGNYTAFITKFGECYHLNKNCVGNSIVVNQLEIKGLHPCDKCAYGHKIIVPLWYKQYKELIDIKEKYLKKTHNKKQINEFNIEKHLGLVGALLAVCSGILVIIGFKFIIAKSIIGFLVFYIVATILFFTGTHLIIKS